MSSCLNPPETFMTNPTVDDINNCLAGAYAPEGWPAWWGRPRSQLAGKTPQQVWDEGDKEQVYRLAHSLCGPMDAT